VAGNYNRKTRQETEWILLTSGTTGVPKLVVHTLASLAGAINDGSTSAESVVWGTFYDIRRYGGLQIFLRAALTGKSLVLSGAKESTTDFLARAVSHGVTHISGTPSQWRRALMSPSAHLIHPEYIRLSGRSLTRQSLTICGTLPASPNHARLCLDRGRVAFGVNDGMAGFPAHVIEHTPTSR
jgi:acyl-CoA synthetase (AMP-forming)/AMP-acid ligase II